MKEFEELKLYQEIKSRYTNLYLLLDDCYEDDKSGELAELAEQEKAQILRLVKKAKAYGVDVQNLCEFDQIKNLTTLKSWYNRCKQLEYENNDELEK